MTYKECMIALDQIKTLGPGWNVCMDEDTPADSFSVEHVEYVREIVQNLTHMPFIVPTALNSIMFEYEYRENIGYLEIAIFPDRTIEAYYDLKNNFNTPPIIVAYPEIKNPEIHTIYRESTDALLYCYKDNPSVPYEEKHYDIKLWNLKELVKIGTYDGPLTDITDQFRYGLRLDNGPNGEIITEEQIYEYVNEFFKGRLGIRKED